MEKVLVAMIALLVGTGGAQAFAGMSEESEKEFDAESKYDHSKEFNERVWDADTAGEDQTLPEEDNNRELVEELINLKHQRKDLQARVHGTTKSQKARRIKAEKLSRYYEYEIARLKKGNAALEAQVDQYQKNIQSQEDTAELRRSELAKLQLDREALVKRKEDAFNRARLASADAEKFRELARQLGAENIKMKKHTRFLEATADKQSHIAEEAKRDIACACPSK